MTATMTENGYTLLDEATEVALATVQEADVRRQWLTEPEPERVQGIFDRLTDQYVHYRVTIKFTSAVMGGTPANPEIVEGWLRTKGIGSEASDGELKLAMATIMAQVHGQAGSLLPPEAWDQALDKAGEVAAEKHRNCFRRDGNGLYLEARHVKAMLRESCNILFAGDRWGKTKKGPRSFLAERVFVVEPRIYLGRMAPDLIVPLAGHVTGPQGPRSTLTQYEVCWQPEARFTLRCLADSDGTEHVKPEHLLGILRHGENIGLGAVRSQSFGQFKVTDLARLKPAAIETSFQIREEVIEAAFTVREDAA